MCNGKELDHWTQCACTKKARKQCLDNLQTLYHQIKPFNVKFPILESVIGLVVESLVPLSFSRSNLCLSHNLLISRKQGPVHKKLHIQLVYQTNRHEISPCLSRAIASDIQSVQSDNINLLSEVEVLMRLSQNKPPHLQHLDQK